MSSSNRRVTTRQPVANGQAAEDDSNGPAATQRSDRRSSAPREPPAPHLLHPRAVYTLATAQATLGLAKETLPREIRLGRLQARKRGGRYFILGEWLLDWLRAGMPHRRWQGGRQE